MGFTDLNGHIGTSAEEASPCNADLNDHSLHFLNEVWNGSIANGQSFLLRWNESIDEGEGDLGLFRIRYPEDGAAVFEPISNLTEEVDGENCVWIPNNLIDTDLYALWVRKRGKGQKWAISPPWKIEEGDEGFHWSNPIGIPIVLILGVYFISVATCLLYRRRRHKKREQERRPRPSISAPTLHDDRNPLVNSVVVTIQTLIEDDELTKKHSSDRGRTWSGFNSDQPSPGTRRWQTYSQSPGWASLHSTLRSSEQTFRTRDCAYTMGPDRIVQWIALDRSHDDRAGDDGQPAINQDGRP